MNVWHCHLSILPKFLFTLTATILNPCLDVAVITGLFVASDYVGGAFGNTIAGAIWNQVLPSQLTANLGNATEAMAVFADPFTYVALYSPDTPQRDAIAVSYRYVQKLICIVGICVCILQIGFVALLGTRSWTSNRVYPMRRIFVWRSWSQRLSHNGM